MTSIPPKNGEDRRDWSNLPVLLLWMIKDKLPFIDNLMVALVCKRWHCASKMYPTEKLQGAVCRSMWLMRINYGDKCWTDGQLTNSYTGKKYFVGSAHCDGDYSTATMVLCSEKGWLLLGTPFYPNPENRNWALPSSPMFLVNPFAKQQYDLPTAVSEHENYILFTPHLAAVSTVDGIPHCVVIGQLDEGNFNLQSLQFILKIAQPNGKEWRTYTYRYGDEEYYSMDCWPRMLIRSNHVYLIDRWGRTLAFDIIGATWTNIVKHKGERNTYRNPVVQSDGAIIRMLLKRDSVDDPKRITHFMFHKLNEDEGTWVNLDHNELEGKCWYLAGCNDYFVAKDMGKTEVYHLEFETLLKGKEGNYYLDTYTLNMLGGGSTQMVSRYRLDADAVKDHMIWVDLG